MRATFGGGCARAARRLAPVIPPQVLLGMTQAEFARALRIPLSTFRLAPKFLLAAPDRPRNRATRGRIREFGLETGLRNPITGASDVAQPAAF